VMVLYLSRTLTGDVAGLMSQARTLLERHGYDPYFIGDEVFWRVTQELPPATANWFTQTPQRSRLQAFDAITSYSLYVGGSDPLAPSDDFEGYPGATSIVSDETALYRRYEATSHGQIPVIPDVTPGVNTRGVRLAVNEPAEPRQWLPGKFLWKHLGELSQKRSPGPSCPVAFRWFWSPVGMSGTRTPLFSRPEVLRRQGTTPLRVASTPRVTPTVEKAVPISTSSGTLCRLHGDECERATDDPWQSYRSPRRREGVSSAARSRTLKVGTYYLGPTRPWERSFWRWGIEGERFVSWRITRGW